jgi:hypothetical protein
MKKYITIFTVASFVFLSCAKEKTCECTDITKFKDESTGYEWTTTEKFSFKYNAKKKHENGPCSDGLANSLANSNYSSDDPDIVIIGGSVDCKLK